MKLVKADKEKIMGLAIMLNEANTISPEEYIEDEAEALTKHEYINGCIYAMAGAKRNHNTLNFNLSVEIGSIIKNTACKGYTSDMRAHIKTEFNEAFYYPDLMVSCDPSDDELYEDNPILIIEILSPSTERSDRGEKFTYYKMINTLEEYVLIHQEKQLIEIYHRPNNWQAELIRQGDFNLKSIDAELTVEAVYNGVHF